MLRTNNLTKVFANDEVRTIALNNVNLEIKKGEFVAIMGPSGCGKTTLLNVLGLLDSLTSGQFFFMDEDVSNINERTRSYLRKKNIGFVFQSFNLIDELTIYENVELPLLYLKYSANERKVMVDSILEQLKIAHRRYNYPPQLSGGQQQRVAVARAVVTQPAIILADEPTGNLDSVNGGEVMELLADLNKKGTTIVMVTHSLRDAERSHRIVHLFDGKIITENYRKNDKMVVKNTTE